jgi:hypothetical protein
MGALPSGVKRTTKLLYPLMRAETILVWWEVVRVRETVTTEPPPAPRSPVVGEE